MVVVPAVVPAVCLVPFTLFPGRNGCGRKCHGATVFIIIKGILLLKSEFDAINGALFLTEEASEVDAEVMPLVQVLGSITVQTGGVFLDEAAIAAKF